MCFFIISNLKKAKIKNKNKIDEFDWLFFVNFFVYDCYIISRNLSISIVKLNFITIVFFALWTCLFWWKKSLNVFQSTLIKNRSLHELFAYLCFHNTFDECNDLQHFVDHNFTIVESFVSHFMSFFNHEKNKSCVNRYSGGDIWTGIRPNKALSYYYNAIEEVIWF